MFVGESIVGIHSATGQLILKVLDNIVVIVINYIFSKWLVFTEGKGKLNGR